MELLRQYLLSVTGAALVCGVLMRLLPAKGTAGTIGKMLTGIFLAFTILRPLGGFRLELGDFTRNIRAEASQAVEAGLAQTNSTLQSIIKDKTQAYILDKAASLDLELTVEVTLSQDELPVPVSVCIRGKAGPYAKARLEAIVEEDLGIAKEKQLWI